MAFQTPPWSKLFDTSRFVPSSDEVFRQSSFQVQYPYGLFNAIVHPDLIPVEGLDARGQPHDGEVTFQVALAADLLRGIDAIQHGHLHIHQHEVVVVAFGDDFFDGEITILDDGRHVLEALQHVDDDLLIHLVVLRHQYPQSLNVIAFMIDPVLVQRGATGRFAVRDERNFEPECRPLPNLAVHIDCPSHVFHERFAVFGW
eukprot:CAMPEP_0198130270 /NCGR_PEP_ID=MMETSP1442-20131203/53535_1 /TAXON_ID= /ORGANISM="Craspedostauros australis, Strain CCMP3328" /LENGTH=200 /DNA_ID=CAMNT_0043790841 /DNA_START=329 /DNA_END=928 /DNA_ORIENTATION=-